MQRRLQQSSINTKFDAASGLAIKAVIVPSSSTDPVTIASRSFAGLLGALSRDAADLVPVLNQPQLTLASLLVMYKQPTCGNDLCEIGELVRSAAGLQMMNVITVPSDHYV